ncbi:MAG: DUF1007 family protein [Rhodobacteraceae bacterium]|nr:DUF1007 family protein [Paracoccaceae bacterium]
MRTPLISVAVLWLSAAPVLTHPHVFIDSGLTFLFDNEGQLAAVQVVWAYDEFYSLLQLEDMGIDEDGDGVLTAEEGTRLAGYDTNWIEGYEGDLYLAVGGQTVNLAGPIKPGAMLQDGRIVSWHTRPILTRVDAEVSELTAKIYDPTFYTAYTTDLGITATGRKNCRIFKTPPDLNKAYNLVEELLYGPGSEDAGEDNFPAVGESFADTITVSCAQPF